jgi:hypothetical protein
MRGDNANVQVRYGDRILGAYTRAGTPGRDVEHLADVRCRGVAGAPEPRLPGRGWASGVRQSKQGSASLAVIQPSCSSWGISSLAGIILSSRDTMAPGSARAVPRSPRGRRPPAPPRRAPRLPPASTAPRGGKRSITGTLGSRSGGHARIMLPSEAAPQEASCRDRHRPAACWKECALTTPIPILLRRDGPVPQHEHRGQRLPLACLAPVKDPPRICKVPMWAW